ncbi:floral homeotic protein PMADS 2 [Amborella trichopoda]|uniref:Uncharacterized protein n=1 Tax=Amborella trichopoda TaxID=13333 RepID=W1P2H0_AMBTC|nr:floral homeotic protein PMADS 2 [Amborella trichopoda]ERN01839.1 hypothetical protein AMTR_s00089p00081270 [Amborella trichopoda]|eukprot:XP_006840164.1 floral homeotic protein PMADS 2 [Amborella trichopoda]
MGRGKIEIKRIESSTNRQVTFTKRRTGILKKAREISVLCDAKVSLVLFSSTGKMFEYCTPSTSLKDMLGEYQRTSGNKLWDAQHEHLSAEVGMMKKENENMRVQLRHLMGEDLNSLTAGELNRLEDSLEVGIASVRAKQMEHIHSRTQMLKSNKQILEEQNKQLQYIMHQVDGNITELEQSYHHLQAERDFAAQGPGAFRVQPIQPNLQQNK